VRIFGKPECRGHRRLAVAIATGETAAVAKERAWQIADAIRLSPGQPE
jgi:phosphoribosylglycinamide formyltransferase 2